MKFATHSMIAAATVLALLAGTTASAQPAGAGHQHGQRHEQMGQASSPQMGHHKSQHRAERMAERMAERHQQLKAALKLTPAQEAAWNQYIAAHQPPERGAAHAQRPDREAWARMTTPQRLDQMATHKAERDARMARMSEATRALYAALDADQQKTFDAQSPMARMGMGGHRRGGQGHHPHSHGMSQGMAHGMSHGS